MHFLAKKAQTQAVHHCTKSFNLKQNNVCLEMKQIFMSKNIWKRMAWISLNKKRNASVFLILIEIFDNGCRQWLQNHCDDCSHGIKDVCYLEEKLSIWKSRNNTLLTEVCIVRTMIFPVAMYGCESWTIKNAEHQRIDAFELWYWRSLLRVPWAASGSNQSILKEINPEYSWKDWCWSSNTLATCCEELTHWKRPWCWRRLRERGEAGNRGWDDWLASLTQWTWVWATSRR